MTLAYITGNDSKFLEAKAILGDIERLDVDLKEVQSLDPREILEEKANEATKYRDGNFVVDDTSFKLDCLNGLPGPLIKWFLMSIGNDGVFGIADKYKDFGAEITCSVCYVNRGREKFFFEGRVRGLAVKPTARSKSSWDYIFVPEGHSRSMGEMTMEEKNAISHRAIALGKLKSFLSDRAQ